MMSAENFIQSPKRSNTWVMSCKKGLDRIHDKSPYQPARPRSFIRAFIVRLQTHSIHTFCMKCQTLFSKKKKEKKKRINEIFYLFVVREE